MEMNYCRRCGTKLAEKKPGLYICENDHKIFSSAYPTANIFFINNNDELLVAVRAHDPGKGMLDVPGGFVDEQETAEEALAREIQEELGLLPLDYDCPKIMSTAISRYNYGGEARTVLATLFWSRLHPDAHPVPDDDIESITYINLSSLNLDDFYGKDVQAGIEELQRHIFDNTL